MFRLITRTGIAFIMVFALLSCNETKTNELALKSEEASINVESPLGQFLQNSSKPAVIKFYAEWCSTCKQYEPTFKKVAASMSEAADFFEVDVDQKEYKGLLKQLKISRIPETVFVNKERTAVTKKLGSIPRVKLEKLVTSQLY